MTKSAIFSHLADKTDIPKKQVVSLFEELVNLAKREAKNGFKLPDFGTLVVRNRKARIGRNPQTGEPIKIPAKRVCRFRVAKQLQDAVLGKK
jgi:DNA-binding protein HU-beta